MTVLFLVVAASLVLRATFYGLSAAAEEGPDWGSGSFDISRIRHSSSAHQSALERVGGRRFRHGASDIRVQLQRVTRDVAMDNSNNNKEHESWQHHELDFQLPKEPRPKPHSTKKPRPKTKPLYQLLSRRNDVYTPHGPKGLTAIRLIGERHSGTTWITAALLKCFPSVNVHNVVVNQKHWIQHSPEHVVSMFRKRNLSQNALHVESFGARAGAQFTWRDIALADNPKEVFNQTFVIAIFRDPYSWMEAMRFKPHHWPYHIKIIDHTDDPTQQNHPQQPSPAYTGQDLAFLDFVEMNSTIRKYQNESNLHDAPWQQKPKYPKKRMIRATPLPWRQFVEQAMIMMVNAPEEEPEHQVGERMCQKGYDFGTISPCYGTQRFAFNGFTAIELSKLGGSYHNPVYEHRSNGTPYAHPLELRSAKIKNVMELPRNWNLGGFLPVMYEDLKKNGTQFLLDRIAKEFGLSELVKDCNPTPPNPRKGSHELELEWEQWITQNTDWEMEARVGYKPRTRPVESMAS